MSASDVAADIGKSAQTVHYHVNVLVDVGLSLPVAERKRHARTERLFFRAGKIVVGAGNSTSPEFNHFRQKAFAAMMRIVTRESAMLHEMLQHDVSVGDFALYQRCVKRMSRTHALEFNRRIVALMTEIENHRPELDDPQVHVVMCMRPTMAQSRRWAAKLGVELGGEPIEDDD